MVRTLDKPRTAVSVPYPLRFVAAATAFLPPRGRRWLSQRMGTARVFLDLDTAARAGYEACPVGNRADRRRADGLTGPY